MKYLDEAVPVRKVGEPRSQPVTAVVGPRIEALLKEWEPRVAGKHRLTATRIHQQLVTEGVAVGERTVRKYLAEKRRQAAEVYIPLIHRPGDESQVDFFEVLVDEAGQRRKAWKFLLRLMYSRRDFTWLYDRCDQVSFLDGHVRAFDYVGGVTARLIYDNLTSAVKRLMGLRDRVLTDRFKALSSHYLFEPCFARPGEGHDKGGVEGRGKTIRLQHLTPIVAGPDLSTISDELLKGVDTRWRQARHEDGRALPELFDEECRLFRPLPTTPFEARSFRTVSISHSATCTVEGGLYSVPSAWARLSADAWMGPTDIRFVCRGETVTRQRVAPGHRNIDYRHYLKELARKPQAVRQVAPELVVTLGEPYGALWKVLLETYDGKEAARVLAGIVGAIHDHGEEPIRQALKDAMEQGRTDLLFLSRHMPATPALTTDQVPTALRMVSVTQADARDYDALMGGVS
jgi:transposase